MMNEASSMLDDYSGEYIRKLSNRIRKLEQYYTSPEWKEDYETDEAGRLPKNLKRGVLSEDGIDDVLSDFRDLEERLAALKEKKL